ncbi:hypothetical protein L6452_22790 [Arctium lappa]|uniref:Uncharacterized protein n=1 Tax=Arctium lappa TaxID=4217 RepID=A0ACB9B2H7_ARCLA|nr:hypothetical protein L6452_22790 [Arctium lappa]
MEINQYMVPYDSNQLADGDYAVKLHPGYKFIPSDSDLIVHYLKPKIETGTHPPCRLHEVYLYDHHPQQLAERKYPRGSRPNRSTKEFGTWKATQKYTIVYDDNNRKQMVGYKTNLAFYDDKGDKTPWLMHEYTTDDPNLPIGSGQNGNKVDQSSFGAVPPPDAAGYVNDYTTVVLSPSPVTSRDARQPQSQKYPFQDLENLLNVQSGSNQPSVMTQDATDHIPQPYDPLDLWRSKDQADPWTRPPFTTAFSPERRVVEFLASFFAETNPRAMSLSLLQGYSSPEEEEQDEQRYLGSSDDDDEEEDLRKEDVSGDGTTSNNFKRPLFDPPNPSASSSLPSAFVAFSEISGPPQFLNNSVGESGSAEKDNDVQLWRHGHRRHRRDKNDMPAGAVMQAKAQLVGIRERVSSDVGNNTVNASSTQSKVSSNAIGGSAKRVATATNPNAEDAADLLRMCLQCGIPKTFSNARGMVCPVCGDRPVAETDETSKKKGSMIKDKEKNKRMKGQSSHATWKSETEMQLRQQFD